MIPHDVDWCCSKQKRFWNQTLQLDALCGIRVVRFNGQEGDFNDYKTVMGFVPQALCFQTVTCFLWFSKKYKEIQKIFTKSNAAVHLFSCSCVFLRCVVCFLEVHVCPPQRNSAQKWQPFFLTGRRCSWRPHCVTPIQPESTFPLQFRHWEKSRDP